MSESASFSKLQPKSKISSDVLLRAVRGNYDNSVPGVIFFRGDKLKRYLEKYQHEFLEYFNLLDKSLSPRLSLIDSFDFEDKYLFVNGVELVLSSQTLGIYFDYIGERNEKKINFLIFNSIIPDIKFIESKIGNWILFESACGELTIQNHSTSDNIMVCSNSSCGDISVIRDSICGEIITGLNSISGGIFINDHSTTGNISIRDNSISDKILISNNCNTGNIIISEHSISDDIEIQSNSKSYNVRLMRNSTCSNIHVSDSITLNEISIADKSICESICIDNECTLRNITIQNDSILGVIDIENNITLESISIIDNSTITGLNINKSTINNNINIESSFFTVNLINAKIPLANLRDCHLQSLQGLLESEVNIYMNGGSLNYLQLHQISIQKSRVLSFTHVAMYVVQLQELLMQGQLILRNISHIEKENIPDFNSTMDSIINKITNSTANLKKRKKGKDKIKEILKVLQKAFQIEQQLYNNSVEDLKLKFPNGPIFRIANSSVNKTEIPGSDLTSFDFEYRDSKLLDCFFSGTKLPPQDKIQIFEGRKGKDTFEQEVSIYNQLRKLYESIGDIVEASKYQSWALNSQQKLLQHNFNSKWYKVNKWFSEEGLNLFTFRLNKWSNNHGESWRRALLFIITVSFTLYSLYFISLFQSESFSWAGTSSFLKHYLSFLDITHKEDFISTENNKVEITFLPKLLDFIGRLLTGYGFYQFIAAFRKHGRKAS